MNTLRDEQAGPDTIDRKSTRLNSSHSQISYAVFCLKKKKQPPQRNIADVKVFEHTTNATAMQSASRTIVLQPERTLFPSDQSYVVHTLRTRPIAPL